MPARLCLCRVSTEGSDGVLPNELRDVDQMRSLTGATNGGVSSDESKLTKPLQDMRILLPQVVGRAGTSGVGVKSVAKEARSG